MKTARPIFFYFLYIFSLLTPTQSVASFIDDYTVSFGMTRYQFRDFLASTESVPEDVYVNYKSNSPIVGLRFDKIFNERWSVRSEFSLSYDLNLESDVVFRNGRFTFDGHSWGIESKITTLYQTDLAKKLFIGMGVGFGNFSLCSRIEPDSPYIPHPRLLLPVFRVEQHYKFLENPAYWSVDISRVDIFGYLHGVGYAFENMIYITQTPDVDQGFRITYSYWNFKIAKRRTRDWLNDVHSLAWTMELKFK